MSKPIKKLSHWDGVQLSRARISVLEKGENYLSLYLKARIWFGHAENIVSFFHSFDECDNYLGI